MKCFSLDKDITLSYKRKQLHIVDVQHIIFAEQDFNLVTVNLVTIFVINKILKSTKTNIITKMPNFNLK